MQRDDAAERMAYDVDWEIVDDVSQRRHVQHMFGNRIERARCLRTVAVPAQVERVDVEIVAQGPRHPIPIARVVEAAVYQQQRRLALRAPIPELQLEPV